MILTVVNPKEAEISNDARRLIKTIKDLKVLSCKNLRNTLCANGYKLNYDLINDYDIGLVENLMKHLSTHQQYYYVRKISSRGHHDHGNKPAIPSQ
ncbi:hypothetical protein PS15p_207559 [Mucor circinelloides]